MSTAASQPRSEILRSVVLMGAAGRGKSWVGSLLAKAAGGEYPDGDVLHPPEEAAVTVSIDQPMEELVEESLEKASGKGQ